MMPMQPLTLDRDTAWQVIEQQRNAIADLLTELSPQEWEQPSLCTGWRVRDVATHLAMTPAPPPLGVMITTGLRAGGNYNRFVDLLTKRYSQQTAAHLVLSLRDRAASRRLPALTNYRNVLVDTMVHGQDIAIPLGRSIDLPLAAAAAATTHAAGLGWPVFDRRRLRGFRLRATDIDWEHGTGQEISGPIAALLLLVTGRAARSHDLAGPGLTPLLQRLT
jgi:uncharacterized protein (TIGR03083 family)